MATDADGSHHASVRDRTDILLPFLWAKDSRDSPTPNVALCSAFRGHAQKDFKNLANQFLLLNNIALLLRKIFVQQFLYNIVIDG